MGTKSEAEKKSGRMFTSLVKEDERAALAALSDEDRARIIAGESVESDAGFVFSLAGEGITVAGTTLNTLFAERKSVARAAAREAYANFMPSQATLSAKLKQHPIHPEVWAAFCSFLDAFKSYVHALGEVVKEADSDRERATQLAVSLPNATRSAIASAKAAARHKGSQKAAAKAGALELWKERNAGKHPKLRTVEQFATEAMRRWPVLTSAKVICGWSAQWAKAVKAGKNPAC